MAAPHGSPGAERTPSIARLKGSRSFYLRQTLGAFASGSVVGGMMTSRRPRTPARHLLIAIYAEMFLLSVAVIVALVTGNGVTSVSVYLVIVCAAVAMGLRNAVVRKLAVPDLTTTVLTLTVTGLAADSRLAGGAGSRSGSATDGG